jgi:hypothetical protein
MPELDSLKKQLPAAEAGKLLWKLRWWIRQGSYGEIASTQVHGSRNDNYIAILNDGNVLTIQAVSRLRNRVFIVTHANLVSGNSRWLIRANFLPKLRSWIGTGTDETGTGHPATNAEFAPIKLVQAMTVWKDNLADLPHFRRIFMLPIWKFCFLWVSILMYWNFSSNIIIQYVSIVNEPCGKYSSPVVTLSEIVHWQSQYYIV